MSVEVIHDKDKCLKAFFCNTTDVAFGPIFQRDEEPEIFMTWLQEKHQVRYGDPRQLESGDLALKVSEWRNEIREREGKRVKLTDEFHDLYGMVGTVKEAYGDDTVWVIFEMIDDAGRRFQRASYPAWDEVEVVEEEMSA
jgi:hypothetical protein